MFYDEFGYSFLEQLWRTWAPRGQRPIVRRVTKDRRALTTAVGLTLSGKICKRYFDGGMDSDNVITALEHLRRFMPKEFVLICDQAPSHTSHTLLAYFFDHPEIVVEPLPKYGPELNPEDGFAVLRQRQDPRVQRHPGRSHGHAAGTRSGLYAPAASARLAAGLHSCGRPTC